MMSPRYMATSMKELALNNQVRRGRRRTGLLALLPLLTARRAFRLAAGTLKPDAMRRLTYVLLLLIPIGCATSNSVYAPQTQAQRDPLRAQRLTLEAVDVAPSNLAKAESLLREALASDLYHGPAHNNLGIIFLKRGQLYEAASEFEWACKLLSGHPDPRVNLAMTLEQAGRGDEALATYTTALEVYPNYLPAMQGLARLQIREGKPDDKTDVYLHEIAMRGESQRWKEWALAQMIKRAKP